MLLLLLLLLLLLRGIFSQKVSAMDSATRHVISFEPLANPGLSFGGRSSEKGASIKAPQGLGFGEGCVPLPMGRGLVRRLCPLPRKFLDFLPQNGAFCVYSDT